MTINVREELKALLASTAKISQNGVAKACAINPGALSDWINGKYKGDNDKIEQVVRGYLSRLNEKKMISRKKIPFVPTLTARKIFEVARTCHVDEIMGVAYGESSVGKTMAVKEYASQNPDVILVESDTGYTAKVVMSEIHQALGLDGRGTLHNVFVECVEKLKNTGRLIIIDEAECLPYKALEMVRRLHDKAEIGILLVGMPRLVYNLRGNKGEYAQLYTRVGIAAKLKFFSEEDTRMVLEKVLPEAMSMLTVFHQVSAGEPRTLRELIRESTRIAKINGAAIPDEHHIKKAWTKLGRAL